jgi:beta-lactamase class C
MSKQKYILLIVSLIVAIAALAGIYAMMGDKPVVEKLIEQVIPVDHSKEIKDVLTQFEDNYNAANDSSDAVGGAVVITYKGQIVFLKCFGVKTIGENDPVDENTLFRLASVSKTVTGVLAGILVNENVVGLDEKVADLIPGFRLKNEENTNNLTVRHLLSHSSGLEPHAFDMLVEDLVPLDEIIPRLNEAAISAPPGKVYGYQNVMYSLFDPVVRAKTQKSYAQVMNEKVFNPFGMKNASVDFESFNNSTNKAFPHQKTEKSYKVLKLNNRYYCTAPAAGVNASISDMGQFLLAISGNDDELFPAEARQITFTPQIESPLKRSYYRNWGALGTKHYALGWRIVKFKNHTIAQHSGFVSGYQAEIAVCSDYETGIAVLTNSPNNMFSTSVPTYLSLLIDYKQKQEQLAADTTLANAK